MKTLKFTAKIITVALLLCLVFTFASCDILNGSLKLESFTVDTSTVKRVYYVGEEVDFSGIKASVKYSDESLNVEYTAEDLTITYPNDITATAGTKTVTVSFMDSHLNVEQSTTFQIIVKEQPVEDEDETYTVSMWEQIDSINKFDTANKAAGTGVYGDSDFIDKFVNGELTYVIGDDNEFVMLPSFAVMNSTGSISFLDAFFSVVEIYVDNGEGYVLLDKTAVNDTNYAYALNGETLVNVDIYNGEYKFEKPIDKVKISVLPSAEHYEGTEDLVPVVLEAKVIDAYNVYEAWQLAVIDNDTGRSDWDDFKTAKGIKDIDPAGIVLHNDINVLIDDAPASFFNISTRDVTYNNAVTGETKVYPTGTAYFKDDETLYRRIGTNDFTIQGNLFTINLEDFPVAASNGVFDASLDLGYGSDFSNSEFLQFEALQENWQAKPEDTLVAIVENVAIKGNASQDFWQEESDNGLLTAGGLILVKASRHADVTLNNVNSSSFFITYFPDCDGVMTINDSKCYDSYQNAAFVWGGSTLTVNDSFINGAGGPVVITMCIYDDDNAEHPVNTVFTNTVVDSHLTGEEIWFTAVNASAIVTNIKALGNGLYGAGLGNFVNAEGKMNIQAVLMPEATDATAAVTEVTIQGTLDINGGGIERWFQGENADPLWSMIIQHPAFAQAAPFLTVEDAEGNIHTIFFNGTTFADLQGNPIDPTNADHLPIIMAFMQAEQVVLSQGGLSVVFEYYHY